MYATTINSVVNGGDDIRFEIVPESIFIDDPVCRVVISAVSLYIKLTNDGACPEEAAFLYKEMFKITFVAPDPNTVALDA